MKEGREKKKRGKEKGSGAKKERCEAGSRLPREKRDGRKDAGRR